MVTPAEKDLWRDSITLSIGGISGAFSIQLNGQKIAAGKAVGQQARQRFKVPKGILEKKSFNVLALHLDNVSGVLASAPILAGYLDELVLAGTWQVATGEPQPTDFHPVAAAPAGATEFTEAGFRPSTTPLAANPETLTSARLSPAESLAKMTTAEDLAVDLVLSEPQVAQPTHLSFDAHGRMWVAQYRQYPYPAGLKMVSRDKYYRARFDRMPPAPPHHDRGNDIISVHEDTDGDGTFDRHRNVLEGLNMANAVVHGNGGLWVMHTPYLLFYPETKPDEFGTPEVRLAGFGLEDTHSVSNGLAWGPDGWLYGTQGSTVTSRVTRPGVDPADFAGVYFEGCMVWRYHPRTKLYEIFAEGGGNNFGLDFDSEGRLFTGHNGGDTRGWHFLPQGLYLKQGFDPGKYGPPANPFAFGQLDAMKTRHPIQRFTHATIVGEGTALPAHHFGRFFAADPLHRKVVIAERYARGSTFETSDSAVALTGADPSFRPVFMANAPDGSIYLADFYEEFIAHGQNYQGQIDPGSGRIFRIRGKELPLRKDVNLGAKTTLELVALLGHPNRWHRQTAVRLLGERRDPGAVEPLKASARERNVHPALDALWALFQADALDELTATAALDHPAAGVRAGAVQLLANARRLPEAFAGRVTELASSEPDAGTRAQLASAARRLPAAQALPLAGALLTRDEDVNDPAIPLLCWWAIEAHCATERETVLRSIPWDAACVKQHILGRLMRRFATTGLHADLLTCARLLNAAPSTEHRRLLVAGFEEAFKGRALPPLPDELVASLAKSGLASRELQVRQRDPAAIAATLQIAADPKAKLAERLGAVRVFGEVRVPESVPVLLHLAKSRDLPTLQAAALNALLLYDAASIPAEVIALYPELPSDSRPIAQALLTSRVPWTLAFLEAVELRKIPEAELPNDLLTRLRTHDDKAIAQRAERLFAQVPATAAPAHRATIAKLREVIAAAPGDPYKGEPMFMQRCSACHVLFHKGGQLGPDLTRYQRDDLSTLLTSIVDPNAEIRDGFRNHLVTTKDGRSLSGLLAEQSDAVLTLRTFGDTTFTIPRAEVKELRPAETSLMPEGLLAGLSDQEVRDFFAYLRIPQPINP